MTVQFACPAFREVDGRRESNRHASDVSRAEATSSGRNPGPRRAGPTRQLYCRSEMARTWHASRVLLDGAVGGLLPAQLRGHSLLGPAIGLCRVASAPPVGTCLRERGVVGRSDRPHIGSNEVCRAESLCLALVPVGFTRTSGFLWFAMSGPPMGQRSPFQKTKQEAPMTQSTADSPGDRRGVEPEQEQGLPIRRQPTYPLDQSWTLASCPSRLAAGVHRFVRRMRAEHHGSHNRDLRHYHGRANTRGARRKPTTSPCNTPESTAADTTAPCAESNDQPSLSTSVSWGVDTIKVRIPSLLSSVTSHQRFGRRHIHLRGRTSL